MTFHPEKKLLFLHIPKNAGKSIELALGFVNKNELKLKNNRPLLNRASKYLLSKTAQKNNYYKQHGSVDVTLCSQHLTLQEITHLGILSKTELKSCFTFAVHRNPWTRALSTYNHFFSNKPFDKDKFYNFLLHWYDEDHKDHNKLAHSKSQLDFIRNIDGTVSIDFLLCYEKIDEDFKKLTQKLNLLDISLPIIGEGSLKKNDYRYYYSDKARDVVAKRFKCDIDYFEYSF